MILSERRDRVPGRGHMRDFSRLGLLGSGLGLLVLMAPAPSFATVIGTVAAAEVGASTSLYVGTPLPVAQPFNSSTFPDQPTLGVTLESFSSLQPGAALPPLSPIVLTASSVGYSSVLGVSGITSYGPVLSNVVSSFNVTSTVTPEELTVLPTYNTPYSGTFAGAAAVPEPSTVLLVVVAGLLMGLVVKRRKSASSATMTSATMTSATLKSEA